VEAVAKKKVKKRKPKEGEDTHTYKSVGLPVNVHYEPWTNDLLKHLSKYGKLSIDLTRQGVRNIVSESLMPLGNGLNTRALRHFRITHLRKYGFMPFDYILFTGWSFRFGFGQLGMPVGNLEDYLHMAWQEYFPKLLVPLDEVLDN
ncbi:hypothetical protein MUP77_03110, partial [Candidatus Bathyarchaeota archaeon]|nr:hypothetical protein [Candidatus Bathyarchaeota archaeon]